MPLKVSKRVWATGSAYVITGTLGGQRLRRRAQSNRLADARAEASAIEAAYARECWLGQRPQSRSFGEAVLSYLDTQRADGDKRRLGRILTALGDVRLNEIDQNAVDRVRRAMLAADASPATVRRGVVTPIRAVMMHAWRRGWCERPHFEIPREPKGRTRFLLPDEAERLITAAKPHIAVLLTTLLGTGMRMAEALELDWREVDLGGAHAILWPDQTKSGRRRDVALPPRLVVAFANLAHREGPVIRRADGQPYADRGREGGGQIKTAWRGTVARSGLDPDLTPHDLRHTWASWHYALNRDLLALKIAGGWSSVALVERYAHLLPVGQASAVARFWQGGKIEAGTRLAQASATY